MSPSGDDNKMKGGPSNGSCRAGARENCGENVPSCIQVTSERRAADYLKCMCVYLKPLLALRSLTVRQVPPAYRALAMWLSFAADPPVCSVPGIPTRAEQFYFAA